MHKIMRIKIRGAWSHLETEIKIAPGLTVITGPSGAGKSSIIRAIRWVAFGEPAGEAFIYTVKDEAGNVVEQADEALVEIETEEGVTITKTRRKGKTKYQLSTMDEPFEKAEVPLEVTQALGITQQSFSDFETALNFAFQLDAPFLLSEPASVGAKILGKLAGTEIVDLATKAVSKETHAARTIRTQAEKDVEAREADLLAYIGLDEIDEQIKAAEYLADQAATKTARSDKLRDLAIKLGVTRSAIAAADQRLEALLVLPQIEADLTNIEKAQQRYDRLLDLGGRLNKTKADIQLLESLLLTFEGLAEAARLVDRLETMGDKHAKLANLSKQYQAARQSVKTADVVLEQTAHLDEAQDVVRRAETALERFTRLRRLKNLHTDAKLDIGRADDALTYVGDLSLVQSLIDKLTANIQRREKLMALSTQHQIKAQTRKQAEANESAAQQQIDALQKELTQVWEELKVCPLCDQPVANHSH